MQNLKLKFKSFALLLTFILFIFTFNSLDLSSGRRFSLLTFNFSAEALTMSNDNFILQGDIKMPSDETSGQNLKQEENQSALGSSYLNYKNSNFSFSVSETLIDFGILYPTTPVTRSNTLKVSSLSGYSILAFEDNEFKDLSSSSLIPDVTCDNGTCTESISSLWTNTLTFGFGYRCDNIKEADCEKGFTDSNYFKQFANISKVKSSQRIMAGNGGNNKTSKITYKLNIPGTQPQGIYRNEITYIATPTF